MPDTVSPELQSRVLDRIDDEEIVRLASDLIRIPSFTTEETPCAEWLAGYLDRQGLAGAPQEIGPGRQQTIPPIAGRGGRRSSKPNGHNQCDPLSPRPTRAPLHPGPAQAGPVSPRLNVGSIIGGRGREHNLRGAYTVSDFCTAYVNVRFNASQTGQTVVADMRRTLDALAADDPRFRYEIESPPALERGLGRLAKAAGGVPKTGAVVQMVRRNLHRMTGAEPEHFGVRLPPSHPRNDTTHLWAADIPCCSYGPGS